MQPRFLEALDIVEARMTAAGPSNTTGIFINAITSRLIPDLAAARYPRAGFRVSPESCLCPPGAGVTKCAGGFLSVDRQ